MPYDRASRAQMAAHLARAQDLPRRDRPDPAQVLRARHVPLPVGRGPARRPPRGLHRHRHRLPLQAHARLQRPAPDGLGRLRPARRAATRSRPARTRAITTRSNIATSAARSRRSASRYDWDREVDTTDPDYYQLDAVDLPASSSSSGLAYEAEVPVNWCPALGTVLANEEVIDGK